MNETGWTGPFHRGGHVAQPWFPQPIAYFTHCSFKVKVQSGEKITKHLPVHVQYWFILTAFTFAAEILRGQSSTTALTLDLPTPRRWTTTTVTRAFLTTKQIIHYRSAHSLLTLDWGDSEDCCNFPKTIMIPTSCCDWPGHGGKEQTWWVQHFDHPAWKHVSRFVWSQKQSWICHTRWFWTLEETDPACKALTNQTLNLNYPQATTITANRESLRETRHLFLTEFTQRCLLGFISLCADVKQCIKDQMLSFKPKSLNNSHKVTGIASCPSSRKSIRTSSSPKIDF